MKLKSKYLLLLALVLYGDFSAFFGTTHAGGTNMDLSLLKNVKTQLIHLSGTTSAFFTEQLSVFSVQVPIGYSKAGRDIVDTNVVQVWLLKTDGTAVAQTSKPSWLSLSTIGDFSEDYELYIFQKIPIDEIAGVVVSYNGKLFCHEIEKAGKPADR